MTYSPYPPGQYYRPAPPVGGRRSPADVAVTVVLFAILMLAALASFYMSLFFAMATDSCFDDCNEDLVGTAYAVTWGGIAVGVIGAFAGTVVAACTRIWMWIWPLLGTIVVVVTFFVGLGFADAVMSS